MSGSNGQSSNGKAGAKHRGRTENLRPPWKPGESGNPSGMPKGTVKITDRLRAIIEKDDGQVAMALATAATKAALKGDFRFWQAIIDRIDGPIKQQLIAEMEHRILEVEMPGGIDLDRR